MARKQQREDDAVMHRRARGAETCGETRGAVKRGCLMRRHTNINPKSAQPPLARPFAITTASRHLARRALCGKSWRDMHVCMVDGA